MNILNNGKFTDELEGQMRHDMAGIADRFSFPVTLGELNKLMEQCYRHGAASGVQIAESIARESPQSPVVSSLDFERLMVAALRFRKECELANHHGNHAALCRLNDVLNPLVNAYGADPAIKAAIADIWAEHLLAEHGVGESVAKSQ